MAAGSWLHDCLCNYYQGTITSVEPIWLGRWMMGARLNSPRCGQGCVRLWFFHFGNLHATELAGSFFRCSRDSKTMEESCLNTDGGSRWKEWSLLVHLDGSDFRGLGLVLLRFQLRHRVGCSPQPWLVVHLLWKWRQSGECHLAASARLVSSLLLPMKTSLKEIATWLTHELVKMTRLTLYFLPLWWAL